MTPFLYQYHGGRKGVLFHGGRTDVTTHRRTLGRSATTHRRTCHRRATVQRGEQVGVGDAVDVRSPCLFHLHPSRLLEHPGIDQFAQPSLRRRRGNAQELAQPSPADSLRAAPTEGAVAVRFPEQHGHRQSCPDAEVGSCFDPSTEVRTSRCSFLSFIPDPVRCIVLHGDLLLLCSVSPFAEAVRVGPGSRPGLSLVSVRRGKSNAHHAPPTGPCVVWFTPNGTPETSPRSRSNASSV